MSACIICGREIVGKQRSAKTDTHKCRQELYRRIKRIKRQYEGIDATVQDLAWCIRAGVHPDAARKMYHLIYLAAGVHEWLIANDIKEQIRLVDEVGL